MERAFNSMVLHLQANDQQRRAFMADVAHELRTPLTIIQGNVEGILDDVYPADTAHLRSILEEVQILSRLTDDLRTLALVKGGDLQLRREPTDMNGLVREIAEAARAQADEAGVELKLTLEPFKITLEIDPERIRQALTNLLFNALHYSPRGEEIRIETTVRRESGGPTFIVAVEDHGPGIATEDLPHVFDRHYKSADSRGMGLGLAIARHIVEAHGGEITVGSAVGKGTRISFSLPARNSGKM